MLNTPAPHPRLARERRTIQVMLRLYCAGQHAYPTGLCPTCAALEAYAHARLEKCPFQEGKPTCARCPVHCYKADMREQVRMVMRYSGPRMLKTHPVLAIRHLLDGFKKIPAPRKRSPG